MGLKLTVQMMSNMSKVLHDTAVAVIRKIGSSPRGYRAPHPGSGAAAGEPWRSVCGARWFFALTAMEIQLIRRCGRHRREQY